MSRLRNHGREFATGSRLAASRMNFPHRHPKPKSERGYCRKPRPSSRSVRSWSFGFRSDFLTRISDFTTWARFALLIAATLLPALDTSAAPLRVFIRAGAKTHGPNQHDHPRFLEEWTKLLTERGLKVEGALEFPSAGQLENTDVIIIYAPDGMKIVGEQRANFEKFLQRGGGLVVIHDGVVSGNENEWAKKVQGGAWRWDGDKKTKWYEGEVGLYFVDTSHPITSGLSNFDWKDEVYYDLDMSPDAHVLATSFENVFILAPQLWTCEKTWDGGTAPYRAFVSLPGHQFDVFNTPHYRAILLRGLAWAGRRANLDEFCRPDEISVASLRYPPGGPTPPEQAASKLKLHPDFDLSLVASEPLVEKVISLDWAPDGKLWVAETPEYPGGRAINKNDAPIFPRRTSGQSGGSSNQEERPAKDRISWLEDSNGDGRMDTKHIFYEGLELVTSFVFYKDGVIVEQAPDILWLRDTDGDGKADKVEKLYTGFGTMDTHAVINNMRWGCDGWIYSAIGYSAGNPKSGDGSRDFGKVTAGIIRFKPDGSAVEQVASGSCNTWGFDFAPDQEMFYSTATCGEHLLHIALPEKALARGSVGDTRASAVIPDHQKVAPLVHATRQPYVQIDWVGQFTAAAGACVYNGGAWPEKWNQTLFLHEPTVCLVHGDVLSPKGATYLAQKETGREDTEFLAGSDLWFRPIHSRVGPDGALYVVDWYNQAAVHNDTRGPPHGAHNAATRPDRDHHFARIWRVQHKQAKKLPTLALENKPDAWIKALSSENGWLRMTAHRLLSERGGAAEAKSLAELLCIEEVQAGPLTRMHALYILQNLGRLDDRLLSCGLSDPDPIVRKNALRIMSDAVTTPWRLHVQAAWNLIKDRDHRVQLNALLAVGTCLSLSASGVVDDQTEVTFVIEAWPELKDRYLQSAAIGCAAMKPLVFAEAAFAANEPESLSSFVQHVARVIATHKDTGLSAQFIGLLARQPGTSDMLKQVALETLGARIRADLVLPWDSTLQSSFSTLLRSSRPGVAAAALPLIARWDTNGTLKAELGPLLSALRAKLNDASLSDDARGPVIVSLVGARSLDPQIVPAVAALLGSSASIALQTKALEALGNTRETGTGAELVAAYTRVPAELWDLIFAQLIKRAEWSLALVDALGERKIDLRLIGPANIHRLRTHSDSAVAAKAREVIEALRGPEQKQKDSLIAKLRPAVEQPDGNLENGHKVFTVNCSPCHSFNNEGRDLAPNLTGMGAHGIADLLVHILDPNRTVEPNFYSTSIETRDDLSYDGIVARENKAEIVIRNASGDFTLRKDNIKSRRSTGLSLMPEGFEALGGEGLRDLLAFLCADEQRFRIADLSSAFTVNTGKGIYMTPDNADDAPVFRKHGLVKIGDVPFDIVSPKRAVANAVVLKGGEGFAKTLPQKVEVNVGVAAQRLHFLGGIGGWAWPFGGEVNKNLPVLKAVLHFADGGSEEMVFHNGNEFADWIGQFDVPGSKGVPELVSRGQIRVFSKEVKNHSVIKQITLESFDNRVAPTLMSITAELPGSGPKAASGSGPTPASPTSSSGEKANKTEPSAGASTGQSGGNSTIRTLIVGAGSAHDFKRWFLEEDSKTLGAIGGVNVRATGDPDEVDSLLSGLDVLYLSNNKPFSSPSARQHILDFASSGKGLLLVHPALWYNWADWPEYNRLLCGGGSRGHDHFAEFEVTVTDPRHPLMRGVPAKFNITDELYWFEPNLEGTPIKVLATARSSSKDKIFPMVFVVEHPKARIAGIALGHDGKAHEHPAYQRLLQNALQWAAGKEPLRAEGR